MAHTPAIRQRVVAMVRAGATYEAVAQQLGMSRCAVAGIVKRSKDKRAAMSSANRATISIDSTAGLAPRFSLSVLEREGAPEVRPAYRPRHPMLLIDQPMVSR